MRWLLFILCLLPLACEEMEPLQESTAQPPSEDLLAPEYEGLYWEYASGGYIILTTLGRYEQLIRWTKDGQLTPTYWFSSTGEVWIDHSHEFPTPDTVLYRAYRANVEGNFVSIPQPHIVVEIILDRFLFDIRNVALAQEYEWFGEYTLVY